MVQPTNFMNLSTFQEYVTNISMNLGIKMKTLFAFLWFPDKYPTKRINHSCIRHTWLYFVIVQIWRSVRCKILYWNKPLEKLIIM